MPPIKVQTTRAVIDYWGDMDQGQQLTEIITDKFGDYHGHIKHVLAYLKISRRLLDLYRSGQRAIPDDVWRRLHLLPDYNSAKNILNDWANEVDPLS